MFKVDLIYRQMKEKKNLMLPVILIFREVDYIFCYKYFQTSHRRIHIKRKLLTRISRTPTLLAVNIYKSTPQKKYHRLEFQIFIFYYSYLSSACEFILCCPLRSDSLIISTINTSPEIFSCCSSLCTLSKT